METENPERRAEQADLELAKEHLVEMYGILSVFMKRDPEKNEEARLVLKDLEKVQSALDIKVSFEELKKIEPQVEQRMGLQDQQKLDMAKEAVSRYLNKFIK